MIAYGAARYEFATGSSLRAKLGEVASGTGTGTLTVPAGTSVADWVSSDGAVAMQWTPTLAAGQSYTASTSFTINAPLVPVPEPASFALLGMGIVALGLRARQTQQRV